MEDGTIARTRYTVLILPHATARFRKLHVSHRALAGWLALVFAVVGAVPYLVVKAYRQTETIDRLVAERLAFEDSIDEVNDRLTRFERQADRIAAEMGIEGLAVPAPAAGGSRELSPGPGDLSEMLDEETGVLQVRARTLSRSVDRIEEAWGERVRMLDATPSLMPVAGFFSHGYGWRRDPFTGERDFHHGVDIVAETGTPVAVTADGVVTVADRRYGYGKVIQVSHGFGYATRYAHLDEILVRPGQRVRRGDLIGRVGSTGRSTGPHLHYEVFRAGRRVDPRTYLGDKTF